MGSLRGLNRAQWLILFVAWLGWVFDIFDTAIFNLRKGEMLTQMIGQEAYKANGAAIEGWIQGVFLLGWAIGGLIFGIVADRYGRTRALIITILTYCAFTGLTALCRTPEQVMVARFLTALGIGGEWAAGAALVAEALPDKTRAAAAAVLQSAAAFGPALAAVANLALAGRPWQWMFIVGVAPAAICVLIRRKVQEPERQGKAPTTPLKDLWSDKELRRRAIVAMVIGAVGIAGAGAATFWAPNLVKAASEGLEKTIVDQRISYVTLASHVGTLAGVLCVPLLCEWIGRKKTISVFYALCPIAVVFGMTAGLTYERLLILMPIVNFFAIGISAAFVLYFPELFPSRVRATGAGLAYNVGRIVAIPMPIIMGISISKFGGSPATAFGILAAIYVFALLVIPLAPETKGVPLT